jgi:cobalt/nickel transport system permease protein
MSRTATAVGIGVVAFVAVVAASVLFSAEYAIGGATSVAPTTVARTTIGTYLVVGAFEGMVTALIVRGLLTVRPDLVFLVRSAPTAGEGPAG